MFVYCLWSGDFYENQRTLLTHEKHYTKSEFKKLCENIREKLIDSTSKNWEIMDTVDGEKSIWRYAIDSNLMIDIRNVLISDYGFQELSNFPRYHPKEVDPYDYEPDSI